MKLNIDTYSKGDEARIEDFRKLPFTEKLAYRWSHANLNHTNVFDSPGSVKMQQEPKQNIPKDVTAVNGKFDYLNGRTEKFSNTITKFTKSAENKIGELRSRVAQATDQLKTTVKSILVRCTKKIASYKNVIKKSKETYEIERKEREKRSHDEQEQRRKESHGRVEHNRKQYERHLKEELERKEREKVANEKREREEIETNRRLRLEQEKKEREEIEKRIAQQKKKEEEEKERQLMLEKERKHREEADKKRVLEEEKRKEEEMELKRKEEEHEQLRKAEERKREIERKRKEKEAQEKRDDAKRKRLREQDIIRKEAEEYRKEKEKQAERAREIKEHSVRLAAERKLKEREKREREAMERTFSGTILERAAEGDKNSFLFDTQQNDLHLGNLHTNMRTVPEQSEHQKEDRRSTTDDAERRLQHGEERFKEYTDEDKRGKDYTFWIIFNYVVVLILFIIAVFLKFYLPQ